MKREQNGRKLIEVSEINSRGWIGYMFEDSKRWGSAQVQKDKQGKPYFMSKGKKFYL